MVPGLTLLEPMFDLPEALAPQTDPEKHVLVDHVTPKAAAVLKFSRQ
jgi:hypothetical protein